MNNTDKRLTKVEMAITPKQAAICHILTQLGRFSSVYDYSTWLAEQSATASPIEELFERIKDSVCKAMKVRHRSDKDIKQAVVEALREVERLLMLCVEVNMSIEAQLIDTRASYRWLASQLIGMSRSTLVEELLITNEIYRKLIDSQLNEQIPSLAAAYKPKFGGDGRNVRWEQEARVLLETLYATRAAHDQVATKYYSGHAILWKETSDALDKRIRAAEQLLDEYNGLVTLHRENRSEDMAMLYLFEKRFNSRTGAREDSLLSSPDTSKADTTSEDHASVVSKISPDEIKQGIKPRAAEIVAFWINSMEVRSRLAMGDPSAILSLMKQQRTGHQNLGASS